MSTKIYNAYRTEPMDGRMLHQFTQELKTVCYKKLKDAYLMKVGMLTAKIIDYGRIQKKNPCQLQVICPDVCQWITNLYAKRRYPVKYRLTKKTEPLEKQDVFHILKERSWITVPYFAKEVTEQDCLLEEITQYGRCLDTKNEIVLFPAEDKTLILAFGDIITRILQQETTGRDGKKPELKTVSQIKDYHYQNQTDQPENISDEEWEQRCRDWQKAIPSMVPSKDGMVIELTNCDTVSSSVYLNDNDQLIPYIPPKEERIDLLARDLTQKSLTNLARDDTTIIEKWSEYARQINSREGKPYETYQKFCGELSQMIPDITKDMLGKPITDYITLG